MMFRQVMHMCSLPCRTCKQHHNAHASWYCSAALAIWLRVPAIDMRPCFSPYQAHEPACHLPPTSLKLLLLAVQIHGHDFRCTAIIPCPHEPGNFRYASGSEEKMIRVLEAPQAFVETLALAKIQSPQPFGTSQVSPCIHLEMSREQYRALA